jgi:heat shock protein HslJ
MTIGGPPYAPTMRRLVIVVTALVVAGCAVTSRVATMDLPGSTWELVSMDGEAVAGDAPPTLAFEERGAVSGSTGCNTFSGDVAIDGNALNFGPLITTRMACADPAANAQEEAFLSAMEGVSVHTVDDQGRLVLQGGPELTFEVAAVGS